MIGGSTTTISPNSVAAADLDGDGDFDLVSANASSSNLTVFLQDEARKLTTIDHENIVR